MKKQRLPVAAIFALFLVGCTGLTKGGVGNQPPPGQLAITPSSATLRGGATQALAAKIDGTSEAVTWSVNGVTGGNGTVGVISTAGVYTAPGFPPSPNSVTIGAIETADATKKASATITLENPTPQIASIEPLAIPIGPFSLTVAGANFASGATINFGTTVLATTRISSTQLKATGTASQAGNVSISVTNPNPGSSTSGLLTAQIVQDGAAVSAAAAVRFLEQSTFGPSPEQVSVLQRTGFDPFLQDQFAQPPSPYPTPAADQGLGKVQQQYLANFQTSNLGFLG